MMGIMRVAREGHPDPTAFDREDQHYDAKSKPDAPTWMMVDLQAVERFTRPVALGALRGWRRAWRRWRCCRRAAACRCSR